MEIRDEIAGGRPEPAAGRIPLRRALGEILAVYIPSFGLGILSALILLTDRNQGADQIDGPVSAGLDVLQYVMQASVTIFGVAYFCQRRGVTLTELFGRFSEPGRRAPAYHFQVPVHVPPASLIAPAWGAAQQPAAVPPHPPAAAYPPHAHGAPPPGYWPGYAHHMAPPAPAERGKGWQFSRAYFVSMAGVLGFLISVIVYIAITHAQTGAPSQGNSPYLVLVGLFVALAAGFGEEMLVTGLTVNALEAAGVGGRRVRADLPGGGVPAHPVPPVLRLGRARRDRLHRRQHLGLPALAAAVADRAGARHVRLRRVARRSHPGGGRAAAARARPGHAR